MEKKIVAAILVIAIIFCGCQKNKKKEDTSVEETNIGNVQETNTSKVENLNDIKKKESSSDEQTKVDKEGKKNSDVMDMQEESTDGLSENNNTESKQTTEKLTDNKSNNSDANENENEKSVVADHFTQKDEDPNLGSEGQRD